MQVSGGSIRRSATCSPQGNGLIDRVCRSLDAMLKRLKAYSQLESLVKETPACLLKRISFSNRSYSISCEREEKLGCLQTLLLLLLLVPTSDCNCWLFAEVLEPVDYVQPITTKSKFKHRLLSVLKNYLEF